MDHENMKGGMMPNEIKPPRLSQERKEALYKALEIEILPMLRELCALEANAGTKQLRMATHPCPFELLNKKGTWFVQPCAYKDCIHFEQYQKGIPASIITCLPCDHYIPSRSNFKPKAKFDFDERSLVSLSSLLSLVGVEASAEEIAGWSVDQRRDAGIWAATIHLGVGDDPVQAPPKPDFLCAF